MRKLNIELRVNQDGKLICVFKMLKINRLNKKTKPFTDHDYIDYLIDRAIETENYERCEKLNRLKKNLPNNNKKRHRIL